MQFPGVAIDLKERCVDIEVTICLDRGMLELVACTKGGKEHESIVAVAADKKVDLRFPTNTFLFAGSHLMVNGPGPRKYLSDESGHVISIGTFGDELLCLAGVHSHQNGALEWQVNAAGLPSVGTKVTLRLRPKPKPAAEGNTPNPVN